MNGTVKFFNRMKGFGFIAGEDNNEYFVHQSDIQDGVTISDNDAVTFDVTEGDRGPKAVNVGKGAAEAPAEKDAEEEASEEAPAEEEAEKESSEEEAEKESSEEEAPVEEEAEKDAEK